MKNASDEDADEENQQPEAATGSIIDLNFL